MNAKLIKKIYTRESEDSSRACNGGDYTEWSKLFWLGGNSYLIDHSGSTCDMSERCPCCGMYVRKWHTDLDELVFTATKAEALKKFKNEVSRLT